MDLKNFLLAATPTKKLKRPRIAQAIFNHLDWTSIQNLLEIPMTKLLFLRFVNMEELRLNYADLISSTGTSDASFDQVQTLFIRDYYSLKRNHLPPAYPFFELFRNLTILDVNFCQFITDLDMERILERNNRFISLCFMGCRQITNRTLQVIAKTQRRLKVLAFTIPWVVFDDLLAIFRENRGLIQLRSPDYVTEEGFRLTDLVEHLYPDIQVAQFALPLESAIADARADEEFMNQKPYLLSAPVLNCFTKLGKLEIINDRFGLAELPLLQNNATIFTILILQRDYDTYHRMLRKFTAHPQLPFILSALEIEGRTLLPDLAHFVRIILDWEEEIGKSNAYLNFNTIFSIDQATKCYFLNLHVPQVNMLTRCTLGEICCAKGNDELWQLLCERNIKLTLPGSDRIVSPLYIYIQNGGNSLSGKALSKLDYAPALFLKNLFQDVQRQFIIQAIAQLNNCFPSSSMWKQVDDNGNTLLHYWSTGYFDRLDETTAQSTILKIVKHFVNFDIGPNTKNKDGETPFYLAMISGCGILVNAFKSLKVSLEYPVLLKGIVQLCEAKNYKELDYLLGREVSYEPTRQVYFANSSILTKIKDTVVACSVPHVLLDSPIYLNKFMDRHPEAIDAEIIVKRKGEEVSFSLIEFALHYFLPFPLVNILFGKLTSDSTCKREILHRWLETKFNEYLAPIPGLLSFAEIDFENKIYAQPGENVRINPRPSTDQYGRMVAFTNLLNRIPLPWLTESLSVCDNCTPIPYFLIHLWLRSGDSDPPDHLQSIIERGGSQTNLLKDKLGNTILHIVARYSPNVLFLEALKNDWLDFKVTNELGETPILVYVKSVSVESPIIPRVIEKYQNHPSVKIANKFDPFTLLAMDSKGRNCFMVTLFREFLRKDPFGSESLLASNILSLIPLLDEKSASELIHFLLSSFPQISVTDVVGRDALETLDEKRWLQMIKKLDSTGVPLNVVMNGATAFDKIVNQAKIEDKWQQLVADARDSLKMKTMVEVHPEILIVNQVYSTPLHQICANPNSAIIGLVKSYPELILVADAMNRLPIHLFLQNVRERDQSSLTMLSAVVGGNTGVFKLKDQFYMTPLMYSIMGDCCFNYTSQDSTVTQYLLQQPDASEHECPETPSQRNAAFLLLQNIIGYGKNEFLPAEGKMYLTPHTVVDIITRWKEHCNLDLELIDEDGGTIVDYWEQHITENNLPLGVNAVLKGGLGNLGAQTAEELFEENQMMEIDAVEEVATETVVQLDVKRGFVEPEEDVWIPPNHVKLAVPEVKKPVEPLDNKKIQEGIIGWRAMQFFERTQGGSEISKQDRNLSPEPLVDIIDEPVSIPLDVQENSSPQKQTGASRTPIPEDQMELSNETLSTDHDVPTMWEEEEVEFGDVISTQPYQIISPPLVSNITPEAPPDETSSETSDDLSVIYQEDPPETLERLTKDLFTAASNADHLSIALFQISGTNTKSKNENDQYPIHCWMLKMAERLKIEPFEFQTMRNLLPSSHRKSMLNHVDALLCTPLSIAITHDVFTWSVFNGFYIQDKRPVTLPVQHIQIKPSEMTSELLQYGATLQDVNRNGYTPWHGLATYIFSREHPNIPGIRLDEHFPLLIIVVVMIVKTFKVVGRMNLNAKDLLGRTGLDYLKERFSKGLLLLSRTDYVDLVRFLTKIGCRFSHQL